MEQTKIKIGDVVMLKSGNIKMTVNAINSNTQLLTCVWFDDKSNEIKKFDFHPNALKIVPSQGE